MDLYRDIGLKKLQSIWHSVLVAILYLRGMSEYARKMFWIAYGRSQQRANVHLNLKR